MLVAAVAIAGALSAPAHAADPVIAAAGDIACDPSDSRFNGGLGTSAACRQQYTSDLVADAGLAKVLVLGDVQYDDGAYSDYLSSYDPAWGRVKSITRPAIGNHDNPPGYWDYFNGTGASSGPAGQRGKGFYSFELGAWHLIALNSNCGIVNCAAGGEQEQWLRQDLAAHPNRCTLAYWHHPRFSSGHDGNTTSMQAIWQALYDSEVDVALVGHSHNYERFAPQDADGGLDQAKGIRQLVVGTGGAFFTGMSATKPNSEVRQNNTYGVLFVTLHPTAYDWEFVSEAGKTFSDSGSGSCHRATPPPSASFTVTPSTAVTGQTVSFTSTSTVNDSGDTIVGHEWDLDGDGSFETDSGSDRSVSRSYTSIGTRVIRLRVSDDDGQQDVASQTLTVEGRPPVASLGTSPNPALAGETVNFSAAGSTDPDGHIAGYEWDLDGNGSFETDSGANPSVSRSYSDPGVIGVGVRVTDDDGLTDEATRSLRIESPPTASFTAAPSPALSGETVRFDASASSDVDGSIARYEWDLDGSGSFETNTNSSPAASRSYSTARVLQVGLRVTDDDGRVNVTTRELTVQNRPPAASISASPNPATAGEAVTLDASASRDPDGTIASYEWDLDGNGTFERSTGSSSTTSQTYPNPGAFAVGVRVTDNLGAVGQATRTLTVGPSGPGLSPIASFTASPNPARTGETVRMDGSASRDPDGAIAAYEWDLDGDGTFEKSTGTTPTTSRSYASAGTVAVRLRVTDDRGATAEASVAVLVIDRPPTAALTAAPNPALTGEPVEFDASGSRDPDGNITSYEWDLDGDGSFETATGGSPRASRTYADFVTLTVRLRVTDDHGGIAETSSALRVEAAPEPSFTMSPHPVVSGGTVSFDASGSIDRDGKITKYEWDLDGNGSFDSGKTTVTVSRSYTTVSSRTIKLRVTDDDGNRTTTTRTLRVNSRAVDARFSYLPTAPLTGEQVTFTSASRASGSDNEIVGHRWDLDGDGTYETDTGRTPTAARPYGTATTLRIGLEVQDKLGNIGLASSELRVSDRSPVVPIGDPSTPPTAGVLRPLVSTPSPRPGTIALIDPFPDVQMTGTVTRRGLRLRRLIVKTPPYTTVAARCRGRRCPVRGLSRVQASPASSGHASRLVSVRLRRFERRVLAPGVKLEVLVTKPWAIGGYTAFRVRKGKPPLRTNRCLTPSEEKPVACPRS